MPKALLLAVLVVIAVCEPSHAELYQYTDEKGTAHITDDPGAVPAAQRKRGSVDTKEVDHGPHGRSAEILIGAAGPVPTPSSKAEKAPDPAAQLRPLTALPAKNEANVAATSQGGSAPASAARASKLPPVFQGQFKAIMAVSSIPPEGASASCAELKAGLSRDWDKIMQAAGDLAEAKKKESLGVLALMKSIWMLKSVAWVAFRHETGPEQCVKEFDNENEKRFEAMAKEINALTEEVKDQ